MAEAFPSPGYKSLYSQTLAAKRITEEFEYFAKVYEKLDENQFKGPDAVLYALEHASKRSKASDLVNDDERVKKLPQGSKVCIIGAGMAGMFIYEMRAYCLLTSSKGSMLQ